MPERVRLNDIRDNGDGTSTVTINVRVTPPFRGGRGALPPNFDPWSVVFTPENLPDANSPAGCQAIVAGSIIASRMEIEAGSPIPLLSAVAWVLEHGMVAPDWLADAFLSKFRRFQEEELTLDESFDLPRQTEKDRQRSVEWKRLRPAVMRLLYEELAADSKLRIDNDLYDRVAERLGIGREKCRLISKDAVTEYGFQSLPDVKQMILRIRSIPVKSKLTG